MENPFLKRATEYLREDDAFLAIISPEPLKHYLGRKETESLALYDRLTRLLGQPGSGKTTIARLFEYSTLVSLLRKRDLRDYRDLAKVLTECQAIKDLHPTVLGCRLPMEADYREFWELPYDTELKERLFFSMVQCRAVLAWFRQLEAAQISLESVQVIARRDFSAGMQAIGGYNPTELRQRARQIEAALYAISGAVVAPNISELPREFLGPYHPFDVLESIVVPSEDGAGVPLQPLVMLDDAHQLHPDQYKALKKWLMRRELRIGRWMLSRLDALASREILESCSGEQGRAPKSPITVSRDTTDVFFQGMGSRSGERRFFRTVARDMARRYLERMPLFRGAGLTDLENLLSSSRPEIPKSEFKKLEELVARNRIRLGVPLSWRDEVQRMIRDYFGSEPYESDVALGMENILLHRFANRVPNRALFSELEEAVSPTKPLTADSSVYEGSRIQLHHLHGRPYFYGFNDLCDASSENPEQFLWLAAELVDPHLANRIQRRRKPELTARQQNDILQERARTAISEWDFPDSLRVRSLVDGIASKCKARSLEPNAPLGAGACAYGFPQTEFESVMASGSALARVLKFAVAYNAITLLPMHSTKNKFWCLLELGGLVLLRHGLTLKRGGFVEGSTTELASMARLANDFASE